MLEAQHSGMSTDRYGPGSDPRGLALSLATLSCHLSVRASMAFHLARHRPLI